MTNQSAGSSNQIWAALGALLGSGALLAFSTNLAKVAAMEGIHALPFLTWSLAGATLILSLHSLAKKRVLPTSKSAIKYYFVAAFFSVAGSNLIFFSAVAHVGVSFVALTISLPPLLTYLSALVLRMEKFSYWRSAGVIFALAGTSVLVAAKWSAPDSERLWILITLFGPVLLAAGNIYRTTHWPKGASPETLAPGMLLAASLTLFIIGASVPGMTLDIAVNTQTLILIVAQSFIFAGQFVLLFILQKISGPVFLSLIGAVSAVFGIPFAVILLGEAMLPALIPSAALIFIGIACMLKQQLVASNVQE